METTTERKPRPFEVLNSGDEWLLIGRRCSACGYPTATFRPRCPVCSSRLEVAQYGPHGTIWSSTIVHVPVPGFDPPHALAYVDLDDGPRILATLLNIKSNPPPPGTRVTLVASDGDALCMEVL
jgi:uncharacterized OB-fold protein